MRYRRKSRTVNYIQTKHKHITSRSLLTELRGSKDGELKNIVAVNTYLAADQQLVRIESLICGTECTRFCRMRGALRRNCAATKQALIILWRKRKSKGSESNSTLRPTIFRKIKYTLDAVGQHNKKLPEPLGHRRSSRCSRSNPLFFQWKPDVAGVGNRFGPTCNTGATMDELPKTPHRRPPLVAFRRQTGFAHLRRWTPTLPHWSARRPYITCFSTIIWKSLKTL